MLPLGAAETVAKGWDKPDAVDRAAPRGPSFGLLMPAHGAGTVRPRPVALKAPDAVAASFLHHLPYTHNSSLHQEGAQVLRTSCGISKCLVKCTDLCQDAPM